MFSLKTPMHNGATVYDWLGTAELAAAKARRLMEAVRTEYKNGSVYGVRVDESPRAALAAAEGALLDALSELRDVCARIDNG